VPSRLGRRREPEPNGEIILAEGDYLKVPDGTWYVRPPGSHAGGIPDHDVIEHEDGTITVSPSILLEGEEGWHGYLKRGVWEW